MKNNHWISVAVLVVLTALVSGCHDEAQTPPKPGNVRFTINARAVTSSTGRTGGILPFGASVYVTIEDASGHEVHTWTYIKLLELNGEYITDPLLLPPGDYMLTDFVVGNSSGLIIYATPKEGSALAAWVDDPLPTPFTVSNNAVVGLDMQVLDTAEYHAEDFGYVTFRVEVAPFPYFKLSVFVHDSSNVLALSPVRAYILDGNDTIYKQDLPAGTNDIVFAGDRSRTYHLALTQPSYRKYTQNVVLGDLLNTLDGAPLSVVLEPAFTFITRSNYGTSIRLNKDIEGVYIDWGDGTVELAVPGPSGDLEHNYAPYDPYEPYHTYFFVSLFGNLSSITSTEFLGALATTSEISVVNLPSLHKFSSTVNRSPAHLDFTHNPLLDSLAFDYGYVKSFDLPPGVRLRYVSLIGTFPFHYPTMNAMIHATWLAVKSDPYQGTLYVSNNPYAVHGFVAYVTDESLEELRQLRDDYGWTIWPLELRW
jgi:hypothetical protein